MSQAEKARMMVQNHLLAKNLSIETFSPLLNALTNGGLALKRLSFVFGPPGNGKSHFAYQMLCYHLFAIENTVCPTYLPFEYDKQTHLNRALSVVLNDWSIMADSQKVRAEIWDKLKDDKRLDVILEGLYGAILDNPCSAEMDEDGNLILNDASYEYVYKMINDHGHVRKLWIIDPFTAIMPKNSSKMVEEQTVFIRKLGVLAEKHNLHVMLISHNRKRQKHQGKEVDLTMSDLAGSNSLAMFTQLILSIDYHEEKESTIQSEYTRRTEKHKRTLQILKTNFGSGNGARLACDLLDGPEFKIIGKIVRE